MKNNFIKIIMNVTAKINNFIKDIMTYFINKEAKILTRGKSSPSFCKVALFLFVSLLCLFAKVGSSNAAIITIKSNKNLSLCRELKHILEEPVNEQGNGYNFIIDPEFNIPKKYKNFRLLKWQDVDVKDIGKYVAPGKKLDEIRDFNEKFKGKARILIQRTRADINHDGEFENFLRFKSSDIKVYDKYFQRQWTYYVPDIDYSDLSSAYNQGYSDRNGFFIFYYKGRFYQLKRSSSFGLFVLQSGVGDPIKNSCIRAGRKCNIKYTSHSSLAMEFVCNMDIRLSKQEAINSGMDMDFIARNYKSSSLFIKDNESVIKK